VTHRRPAKHSLTLRGHRTSVTLEEIFWKTFCDIARRDAKTINGLAAEIDAERGDLGLASAIRVYVLERSLAQGQSLE
jgi:predicted DNA-binding ribbon-helix-helix protein